MISSAHGSALGIAALLAALLMVSAGAGESMAAPKTRVIERFQKKPPKPAPGLHGIDRDLDEMRARGLGTVPEPLLQAYLQSIVDQLVAAWGLPAPAVRVHLSTDIGFGAEITPDGNLFVDMRLLGRCEDEDAMAAILAHEIAHLLLAHPNKARMQKRQEQALLLTALAIEANRSVSQEFGVGVEVTNESAGRDYQDIAYRLNRDVITPGWGRKQEIEADRLGTDLLLAAGYDPSALLDYLALLADQAEDSAGMLDAVVEVRTALIADSVDLFAPETPTTGNVFGDLLVGSVRDVVETKVSRQLAEMGRTHPDPKERVDEFMEYLELDVFLTASSERRVEPWIRTLNAPGTREVLANYEAAFALQARLGEPDVEALEVLAGQSLQPPTRDHPFPRFVASQLSHAKREPERARQHLESAVSGPEPSGRLTTELVGLYFDSRQYALAADLVEAQWSRMGEAEALYPLVIRARLYTGRQADAMMIAQRCAQSPLLSEDCQRSYVKALHEIGAGPVAVGAAGPGSAQGGAANQGQAAPPAPVQAAPPDEPATDEAQRLEDVLNQGLKDLSEGFLGFGRNK